MKINGLRELVKNYQERENVSLAWLADNLGVSDKTLFNILESETIPKTETFYRFAKFFGFDLSIIDGEMKSGANPMSNTINGVVVKSNVQVNGSSAVLEKRVKELEKWLNDKEMIIELLKEKK